MVTLGLIYDVVGVLILGLALSTTPTVHLEIQSGTYWGGNKSLFRALMLQRADSQFGLTIIVIGFILQILGRNNFEFFSNDILWMALFFFMAGWLIVRDRIETTSSKIFDRINEE